ncbi:hypothetical protein B0H14DRAFT_2591114 [Mycena olivaceomarginata]|nr:hypothetical protein B0H14DRAFT_2591114 [Mycena olivaceomarginata]
MACSNDGFCWTENNGSNKVTKWCGLKYSTDMGALMGSKDIVEDIKDVGKGADGPEQAQRSEEPAKNCVTRAKRGTQNTYIAGNQHQELGWGDSCRRRVNGVRKTTTEEKGTYNLGMPEVSRKQGSGRKVTTEEMPLTTRNNIEGQALAWQRQDTKTQATDLGDQIPELKAKSQSKNRSGFSRSAQKVDERGQWKKAAEGDMEAAEKSSQETPRHSEING